MEDKRGKCRVVVTWGTSVGWQVGVVCCDDADLTGERRMQKLELIFLTCVWICV